MCIISISIESLLENTLHNGYWPVDELAATHQWARSMAIIWCIIQVMLNLRCNASHSEVCGCFLVTFLFGCPPILDWCVIR
jgi:hypothetical protein